MGTIINKQLGKTYLENIEENEILISPSGSSVTLGTLVSIIDKQVLKSGGVPLLSNLSIGDAIKVNDEIKRVAYILDDDTFYVTTSFLDTHVDGSVIYKDFYTNNSFLIKTDNFGNTVMPTDLTNENNIIKACTVFTGCNSLFLYNEYCYSFIDGTYNTDENNLNNVDKVFIAKINSPINYIINMEMFEGDLNDEYYINITDKKSNVYSVLLNGRKISNSDYTIEGIKLTITNTTLLRGYNYVTVYHYPLQTSSLLSGVEIRLRLDGYDRVFINNTEILEDYYYFNWMSESSSTPNYEFYSFVNKQIKRNNKVKVNSDNTITFSCNIGEDNDNEKNITTHLINKLKDRYNFRLVKIYEGLSSIEYWYNCRLINPTPYSSSSDGDTISYTIEFKEHVKIKSVTWGENNWGSNYWGVECEARD